MKGVLKNFAKFTGKHLRQSLFLNKVAGHKTPSNDCFQMQLCFRTSSEFFQNFSAFIKTSSKISATKAFRTPYPDGIDLFLVISGNTRAMCEICSKLTMKIPEQRQ